MTNIRKGILQLLPLFIIVGSLSLALLSQMGYITLPRINLGQAYKIQEEATVGEYKSYEFSALISSLGPKSGVGTDIYTYYLGSGVGFPPMGLTLDINGVLKGTPTAQGTSKFQVCVKDVGGKSACRTYSLTVNPATVNPVSKSKAVPSTCPTKLNPPCGSAQNGVAAAGGLVPASCDCPSDSTYASMDNVAPGGPYKICVCK